MTGLPTIFGDGVTDVHVANGVARITFGAATGQQAAGQPDAKPMPSGMLVLPVLQLPAFARVLVEVTRQVEQRAKAAAAAASQPAAQNGSQDAPADAVAGAFRFTS